MHDKERCFQVIKHGVGKYCSLEVEALHHFQCRVHLIESSRQLRWSYGNFDRLKLLLNVHCFRYIHLLELQVHSFYLRRHYYLERRVRVVFVD